MHMTVGRLKGWDIHMHSCGSEARPNTIQGMESHTRVRKIYPSSPVSWPKSAMMKLLRGLAAEAESEWQSATEQTTGATSRRRRQCCTARHEQ
eukprot:6187951-Pleurochrysis_carterae.AAC.1